MALLSELHCQKQVPSFEEPVHFSSFVISCQVAVPLVCHGHSRPVVDLFYNPVTLDRYFLISASKDSTPMLRNGETGDWIGIFEGHKVKFWDANHSGLVKSYDMSCNVESASLEPKLGDKFITGGEDMWIRLFDFNTGEEIGLPGVLLIPSFAQTLVYFEFYRL
ncbi:putative transcription factor WD40-like family [Helianthus debilis subsp. tardiflorus]